MKNTFAVSMTLLVALTLGGSFAAFQRATTPHQAEAGHGGAKGSADGHGGAEGSADGGHGGTEGAAGEGHGEGEASEGIKGDDVVTDSEAAVNAGEGDPLAAPGGTGPEVVQDRDVTKLQNNAGGPNAGVTGQVPETGTVAGDATSAPGGNPEVAPEAQADDGAERSPGGVSGETDEGNPADTNSAGATGQPPAESALAGDPKGDPVAGKFTYAASCAGCHGQEGEGGIGPALNGANGPKAWTLDQFTAALREGRTPERELAPTMPRFSKAQLTDSDVTNIYRHIKTLN